MKDDFSRFSKLQRRRIGDRTRGKFGINAHNWKGEKAGYVAKHMWIVKHNGNAFMCQFDPRHKAKRFEWSNLSGLHRRDISDYIMLCPSCHRIFDKGLYCKWGHKFTLENTRIIKGSQRICRKCNRIRLKNRYNKRRLTNERI